MENDLVKICPVCNTENNIKEIMCIKCGVDISYIKCISKSEMNNKKENIKNNITQDDISDFKKAFSEELKYNKRKTEIYKKTKEDEEAEKILAEMKTKFENLNDKVKKEIKKIIDNLTKR